MVKKIRTPLGTMANDNLQKSSDKEVNDAIVMTKRQMMQHPTGSVHRKVLERKLKILQSHKGLKESSHLLNKKVMTIDQLAKKHKVAPSHIAKQLKMGIKVEKEHTTFFSAAKKIALAHLAEDPNYYTKLKTVERK